MSMRRKLHMSDEMLSSIRQKFKQIIADAYLTFQGTRGARHGAQPCEKHQRVYVKDPQEGNRDVDSWLFPER